MGVEAFATIALAADAGVRLVDCPSDPEEAERIVGQVLPREPAFRVMAHTAPVEGGADGVLRRLRTSLRRMKQGAGGPGARPSDRDHRTGRPEAGSPAELSAVVRAAATPAPELD